MADVAPDAQHEFWRPPVVAAEAAARPGLVEVCDGCASEFMVGSLYCHVCGASREARPSATPHWTLYLEFHNIKRALGLSTASLVAFVVGLACLMMAGIAVGLIYSVQTFNDFQAVQFYRMQWLLGAIAAFAAGLLLKKSPDPKR
jgi:vacuolar-type H+-ATPase subunit I/STV1